MFLLMHFAMTGNKTLIMKNQKLWYLVLMGKSYINTFDIKTILLKQIIMLFRCDCLIF